MAPSPEESQQQQQHHHPGSGSASQSAPPSSLNPLTTFTGLVVIVLISTISVGVAIALLLLYLRKRKRSAQRRLTVSLSGIPEIRAGDSTETERSHVASTTNGTERNRLRKFGGSKDRFEGVEIGALSLASMAIDDADSRGEEKEKKRHRSLPVLWGKQRGKEGMLRRLTEEERGEGDQLQDGNKKEENKGLGLGRSQSCAWPSSSETKKLERAFSNRSKPNWLDEDLLHGPRASTGPVVEMPKRSFFRGGSLKERAGRGSWPVKELGRQPPLPRVHHTVHGYPSGSSSAATKAWGQQQEQKQTEIGLGSDKIKGYGCLRLGAGFAGGGRVLPEPPGRAVVAGTQGGIVRSNIVGAMVGSCGQQQQALVQQRVVPPVPPHRSLPQTPPRAVARGRSRAQSTDSTLSEILKSTEKRLRAGSVSGGVGRGRHMRMGPLNTRTMSLAGTSQECLLPKKGMGHRRQDSEVSVVSESDSLAEDESPVENPAGLTSPSRSALVQKAEQQQQQQPERQVEMVIQSPRSSISSSLSTVFSEDEMPEEVKKAIMPLDGLVVVPQPVANVQAPAMNDPFITAPIPLPFSINKFSPRTTSVGLRQPPKTQGLFRESLERSTIQRRMTVGSPSQDLILAPGPSVAPGSKLIQQQDDVPRIPTGPLFLRLTKTSTLSTIPILPPPAAPGPVFTQHQQRRKTLSPVKTVSFADELHQVHNVPRHSPTVCPPSPTRPSKKPGIKMSPSQHQLQLSLARNGNRDSICSTYSVKNAPASVLKKSATAQEVNNASFFANSLLYPSPLNLNHASKSTPSLSISPSPSNPTPDSDAKASASASDSEDEDDIPLTNTVASLRRMNSQISTSSVISLHNENPKRFSGNLQNFQKRKSIGARNYLSLGANVNTAQRRKRSQSVANGSGVLPPHSRSHSQPALPQQQQKRPGSRVGSGNTAVGILNASLSQASLGRPRASREIIPLAYPVDKRQPGWEWGGNVVGAGNVSPPHKRRKPGSVYERRQSLLRMSVLGTVADSSLVAAAAVENNKEKNEEGFILPVREDFTFHSGYAGLGGSMSLGNFGAPGRMSGNNNRSPVRNSVESLGLYDRQGFLITSPVRNGGTGSPLRGLMVQQERLQSSPSRLRI